MSQRQDQSSTRALVGVWKCLGLGMSGVSLRALVLASVALALLGCTTPDAVRQFTAMATEGAAQSRPLVQDITASCIRKQLADRPLNEIADVTAEVTNTCKEFSDQEPNLLGAVTVLTQYLNALAQLAADQTVTYDKQIDAFAAAVQPVGNFQTAHVTAIKGLAKFLFDAAASGYQRKKLGNAVKAADVDITTLADALGKIIGTDYDRLLRNEEESDRTRYREALRGDSNRTAQLLLQERWRQDLATLTGKRRAAQDYVAILTKIRDGHRQLAAQVNHWDAQQLVQILKPYAGTIKDLMTDFRTAYFSQPTA
jgi:DNA-binding ferritin-like protein (Dps family)